MKRLVWFRSALVEVVKGVLQLLVYSVQTAVVILKDVLKIPLFGILILVGLPGLVIVSPFIFLYMIFNRVMTYQEKKLPPLKAKRPESDLLKILRHDYKPEKK